MNSRMAAATYVAQGWSVFPIRPKLKHPAINWKPFQTRHPTTAELDAWFEGEDMNLGIVTGPISNLIVVDFDSPDALERLESEVGHLPPTPRARTAKGVHLYFQYPEGVTIKNRAGVRPQIDVRGEGGYVVAPPSTHASGHSYTWEASDHPLAPLPTALVEMFTGNGATKSDQVDGANQRSEIPEGQRNSTLASLTGQLLARGVELSTVSAVVHQENALRCRPPLPRAEVDQIVRSISAREEAKDRGKKRRVLQTTQLSDFSEEAISWIWPGVLPAGHLVIFDGAPGAGKSLLVYDLIARYTTGCEWPDGSQGTVPSPVLLVEPEDHIGSVVKPRMRTAGAEDRLIHLLTGGESPIALPRDTEDVRAAVERLRPGIVVVDPLTMLLDAGLDDNKRGDLVAVLGPMRQMAHEFGFCLIVVRHTRKNTSGGAMSAGAGSFAGNGIARAVFLVGKHPHKPGVNVLATTKLNLGAQNPSQLFRIRDQGGVGSIEWAGQDRLTADELAQGRQVSSKTEQALGSILGILQEKGEAPWSELKEAAMASGASERTAERIKHKLETDEQVEKVGRGREVILKLRVAA